VCTSNGNLGRRNPDPSHRRGPPGPRLSPSQRDPRRRCDAVLRAIEETLTHTPTHSHPSHTLHTTRPHKLHHTATQATRPHKPPRPATFPPPSRVVCHPPGRLPGEVWEEVRGSYPPEVVRWNTSLWEVPLGDHRRPLRFRNLVIVPKADGARRCPKVAYLTPIRTNQPVLSTVAPQYQSFRCQSVAMVGC